MARPRIRSLKPDMWQDQKLGSCSIGARLLFVGLITQADDDGRFRAAPTLLRAAVFPHDDPLAGVEGQLPGIGGGGLDVDGWLAELAGAGIVRVYEVRGEQYGDLPGWRKHQRVDHPRPSELPPPPKKRRIPARAAVSRVSRESSRSFLLDRDRDRDIKDMSSSPSERRPARVSSEVEQVWQAYAEHHPRATFTTTGKNHRRGLIERALRTKPVDELVAAVHGIHTSDYHVDGGHAANLELTLRDADHIERYAAMWEPWASRNGADPTVGANGLTRDELAAAERAMGG